jgi:hypothetical protein
MQDAYTSFETSVSELAMEEGLPPGADEQIVAHVRSLCPGAAHLPVRAEFLIPPRSVLAGEIRGCVVRFLKRYQGEFFAGYRVGTVRVGVTGLNQEVRYCGILAKDGRQIEGHWEIANAPRAAKVLHRTEGTFVLRRED